ncbi:MAG TPA: response regulator, partial [Candidatus Krumholzibacterium sp.]|nr:response regulator [Candidatus Krumholzibacterium sp.]
MRTATTTKKILIADPSQNFRHSLCQFLSEKGFAVIDVSDGSRALSETLLKRPDILLLDLSVGTLGAERLVQILRTNPNTDGIPIFFMSEQEKSVPGFRTGIDQFIRKPFHGDEVLLRIQRTLYKDDIADFRPGDSEISGNLAQIFLPDLWQMLSMNARSGVIQVEGEGMSGSIYIDNGEIVSAQAQN